MIDTNVYLSRWPCRRLELDEAPRLAERLRRAGVKSAWAGSFDALLHKDLAAVNSRLADECRAQDGGLLVPFGAVNPLLPDWEEDLRRCAEVHKMPGIRLHPSYHGYELDAEPFRRLLALAAKQGLIVQIALRMEDPRTQHPLLTAKDVNPEPLVDELPRHPRLRVQLLNALNSVRPDVLDKLAERANLKVEIAMLEGVEGISRLLSHVQPGCLCFGSYAPFFALEAALGKLQESALSGAIRDAIANANADQFLAGG